MGQDSRSVVSQAKPGTLFCVLEVGYQNENFTLFKGSVQTGGSRWNGYQWETTFKAVDGLKSKKKKINKTYPKKTDLKKMLKDTLKQMEDGFKNIIKDVKSEISENGITLSGAGDMVLDRIISMMPNQNLERTIQDEVTYVKPVDSAIDDTTAAVIAFDTGMIGAPKKTEDGIEFKSLLSTGLSPGRKVIIKSIEVSERN